MSLFDGLTPEQRKALERIVDEWVDEWIDEGFTTQPYEDAYYDIFEALGLDDRHDARRPQK